MVGDVSRHELMFTRSSVVEGARQGRDRCSPQGVTHLHLEPSSILLSSCLRCAFASWHFIDNISLSRCISNLGIPCIAEVFTLRPSAPLSSIVHSCFPASKFAGTRPSRSPPNYGFPSCLPNIRHIRGSWVVQFLDASLVVGSSSY